MLLLHYTSLRTLCKDFSISATSLSEKKTASESSIIFLLNRMLPDDNSGEDICFCKIVEIFLKCKANADERCVFLNFLHSPEFLCIYFCLYICWMEFCCVWAQYGVWMGTFCANFIPVLLLSLISLKYHNQIII